MNKELINKYKTEFDHWLNEGKILYKHTNSNAWWNEEPWSYSLSYVTAIIINDEYVEFRKALVEGKTIQLNGTAVNGGYGETWNDCNKENLFIYGITAYRIKPDEPKFKVGDFVRYIHANPPRALEINNINGNRYYFTNSEMSCLEHELELWTPVKGEWCWFFNDDRIPTISQFVEVDDNITRKYFAVYPNRPKALGSWYKKCEPFLNSLPSHLKDK